MTVTKFETLFNTFDDEQEDTGLGLPVSVFEG